MKRDTDLYPYDRRREPPRDDSAEHLAAWNESWGQPGLEPDMHAPGFRIVRLDDENFYEGAESAVRRVSDAITASVESASHGVPLAAQIDAVERTIQTRDFQVANISPASPWPDYLVHDFERETGRLRAALETLRGSAQCRAEIYDDGEECPACGEVRTACSCRPG